MDNTLQLLINDLSEGVKDTFKLSNRIPKVIIKAINNDELADIRKSCIKINSKGKTDIDMNKMQNMICAACTLEPNFNNVDAIREAKVGTGADLVNKLLLPGERDELYKRINKISGYDVDLDEEIVETKKQ